MSPSVRSDLSRTVLLGGMVIERNFIPEGIIAGTATWTDGVNYSNASCRFLGKFLHGSILQGNICPLDWQ